MRRRYVSAGSSWDMVLASPPTSFLFAVGKLMLQVCFSQPRAAQVRDEGQGKSNGLLQLTSRGQQAGPNEVQFGEEEGSYANHSAPENSIITQVGQQGCCFHSSKSESLRGQ